MLNLPAHNHRPSPPAHLSAIERAIAALRLEPAHVHRPLRVRVDHCHVGHCPWLERTTVEVEYGITSLATDRADAAALLVYLRDHWRIENSLQYVRDVTRGEDACRVRAQRAPQVLAELRNAVVHLLAAVEARSRPEAIEYLQIHPEEAKRLIGIPQTE